MGLLDIFTEELPSSWEDEEVQKWKGRAQDLLTSYYLGFRGRPFFEYAIPEDANLLIAKICFAMFGSPTILSEDLWNTYPPEQQQTAREILDQILEAHKKLNSTRLLVGNIFIACKAKATEQSANKKRDLDVTMRYHKKTDEASFEVTESQPTTSTDSKSTNEFALPLFVVYADQDNPETNPSASRMYVDSQKRIYKSWNDWKENNTLPMLKYAYPKYGFFSSDDSGETYEFDESKSTAIEFGNSPSCALSSRIVLGTDVVGIVTTLGCGAVAISSMFTPVGPAVLLGSAITGGSFGVYGTVRAGQRLFDKGSHGESMADLESFALYVSILTLPLHAGSTFVTSRLAAGAANGRIFSNSFRTFATMLNITTLGADSLLLACGLTNLVEKFRRDALTPLDVVQFSMSVFFFTNTLIKPTTARAIIEHAQKSTISKFEARMTDSEAQAAFERFMADNRGKGSMIERSKIIRTINRIEDPNTVFGKLAKVGTERIAIGGRKGKSLLVSSAPSELQGGTSEQRISLNTFKAPKTANSEVVNRNFLKSVQDKLGRSADEVEVNGEKIFTNLEESQQLHIESVFKSVRQNLSIIKTALDLAKIFDIDTLGTLEKVLTLIEIISTEVNSRNRVTTSIADVLANVLKDPFIVKLRNDAAKAMNIAQQANLPYDDPLKAAFQYRKHGEAFPRKTWNPNTEALQILLKNLPESFLNNEELSQLETVSSQVNQAGQYAVIISKDVNSNICTMTVQSNVFESISSTRTSHSAEPELLTSIHAPNESIGFGCNLVNIIECHLAQVVAQLTGYSATLSYMVDVTLEDGRSYPWDTFRDFLVNL